MRKRLAAAVSTGAVVILGSVLGATPAHAADYTVDCFLTSNSTTNVNISRSVGDTYTIRNASIERCTGIAITTPSGSTALAWTSSNGSDTPASNPTRLSSGGTLTVTAASTEVVTLRVNSANGLRSWNFNFTITSSGNAASTPPPPTPDPILQQFGRPASGTCDAAAPISLNWSGVTSGGWTNSWAQWMNGGLGGPVCTRTLAYSTAQSKWVVA